MILWPREHCGLISCVIRFSALVASAAAKLPDRAHEMAPKSSDQILRRVRAEFAGSDIESNEGVRWNRPGVGLLMIRRLS
jgi:hypothetical protein